MPANYILLERIELNASAASVTFNNIPQSGYTDLKIVVSGRQTSTDNEFLVKFNGTSTGYSSKVLYGTGSAAGSFNGQTTSLGGIVNEPSGYTANTFASSEFYIPNYTSSNFKSISADSVQETNATYSLAQMTAGLWSNTAAITTIEIAASGGSFAQYSTFSLYGLAAVGTTPVIAPKASGGNRIDNDGTYWYHTFTSTGAFVPTSGLSCDVLVIAGGGGGGKGRGGGGGAGGLTYYASQALISTNYTCTVGAGGAGGTSFAGAQGGNSQFASLTASVGGGFGGSANNPSSNAPGGNGGSGGGGAGNNGSQPGGSGTSGQGNSGGAGPDIAPNYGAGGGGGASSSGAAGTGTTGGNGGGGSSSYSSWASATSTGVSGSYAGGGGGGTFNGGTAGVGQAGGGTATTNNTAGTSATANTGSGGGGGGVTSGSGGDGGNGASGIVIIRYTIA